MFVVFHKLPLTVMFLVVLAISVAVCWAIIGLVRFAVPRLGYELDEPLPIRDSVVNACGGLFALIVAFSAAGIWNDSVSARTAVQREADAIENIQAISGLLPPNERSELNKAMQGYLREVVSADWPAMARGLPLDDATFDQAEVHLLGAIHLVSQQAAAASYAPLLNQLLEVRHARLARLAASGTGVTWAQWSAMWLMSSATLFLIVVCNSHALRMLIVAAHTYVLVVAAAYFVILAHDRPFIGRISVQPTAFQALLSRGDFLPR